jgi:predicted RNA-binding Zn-ribbon protein involved in translation (DUF1610 family)
MTAGQRSIPYRCPDCRQWAGSKVRRNGVVIGWAPEATYVGYLLTDPFAGWKRPPAACPNCGTALVPVEDQRDDGKHAADDG